VAAALSAIATSNSPYMRSGLGTRSATFPKRALPIPNPAMKMAITAAAAAVVAPKMRRSSRIQAIWNTRAAQPEVSTNSATTASGGCAESAAAASVGAPALPDAFRFFLLRFARIRLPGRYSVRIAL
jgi:hypothetical protein